MAIPTHEQLHLPMLKFMADNKEQHRSEIFEHLDKEFQFTDEDEAQRLPSGSSRLDSRKVWALAHLKHANLLENTARGYYKITKQGLEVLKENPSTVTQEVLLRYAPADSKFFYPSKKDTAKVDNEQNLDEGSESSQTPLKLIEENYQSLENTYQLLKDTLSNELLQNIKNKEPDFFEQLVVDLLLAMGYGGFRKEAGEVTGKSHDSGIDGIIKVDELGLDIIYLQAKRYQSASIGEKEIRDFVGALTAKHAQKGIFITTSSYTKSARKYIQKVPQKVILIDGDELVDLMIKNNVGVSKDATFEIKKIDSDYFKQ